MLNHAQTEIPLYIFYTEEKNSRKKTVRTKLFLLDAKSNIQILFQFDLEVSHGTRSDTHRNISF